MLSKWENFSSSELASNNLREYADSLWLESEQVAAIRAIINWKLFLVASWKAENIEKDQIIQYFETHGYVWDKQLSAHAIRGKEVDDKTVQQLLEDISHLENVSSEFCSKDPKSLKKQYPHLSPSKISLLQEFIRREIMFERINFSEISAQFPFKVSKNNFFGRFIGGCEWNPQNGIRHLRSAVAFFTEVKTLIEGLHNDKKNFLQLSSCSLDLNGASIDEHLSIEQKWLLIEARMDFQRIIQSCIEWAKDMMDNTELQQLRCIHIPIFPSLFASETSHILPKEQKKLAIEIMNWVFFGVKDGELLNRKSLSIDNQNTLKKYRKEIPQIEKDIKIIEERLRTAYDNYEKNDTLENKNQCNKLEQELSAKEANLDNKKQVIKDLESPRKRNTPLIEVLESKNMWKTSIKTFRNRVKEALDNDEKIVFTTFESDAASVFSEFFDRAFAQKNTDTSGVWKVLKNCSFLMSGTFVDRIEKHKTNGASVTRGNIRNFEFIGENFNASARAIIEQLLPQKSNLEIRELMEFLLTMMPITWISIKAQLQYLVSEYFGKKTPNIDDYLEYTFEHLVFTDKDIVLQLLETLVDLWHKSIPQRCKDIAIERFHISPEIFDQFEVYVANYKPNSLGALPSVFENRSTLNSYLDLGLDAYGMREELSQIEQLFLEWKGVIWIVDTTEYHPELVSDGEKSDTEQSDEVWGAYVRPAERFIRALWWKLMEGRVLKELQNYSFVSVAQPSDEDMRRVQIMKMLLGINLDSQTDLSQMAKVISELHNYDENTILVVNAESVKDFESYKTLLTLFEKFKFKVIIQLRKSLPGIPQVILKPFLDSEVTERIMAEEPAIRKKLWLKKPLSLEVVSFAANQVKKMREPSDDPLNLTLQVIYGAVQNARLQWYKDITLQDITASIAPIFHLPDGELMKSRIKAIDDFILTAPQEVLWQGSAIRSIGQKVTSHILALRDPSRPLTLLLPGPTGVWKTEVIINFAQAVNMPFFKIEWAEFSEEHTVSRLVGSPSGYKGDDKGILFKFLEGNTGGIIFIDEIEKMHPAVYTALMNFFDKATLTAGDGSTVKRPWFIIVGASNAWADRLTPEMSIREVKNTLSEAFVDQFGRPRPELVGRFDPIVMLAIEKEEFRKVIELNLDSIGNRYGVISANIKIVEIDDTAIELLYNESIEVCKYSESERGIGFSTSQMTKWVYKVDTSWEKFYDMRHISRALDTLLWDNLAELIKKQLYSWAHKERDTRKEVRLIGNIESGKIEVEDL